SRFWTAGNMPSYVGPEFFQFRAFIAMLITPIQLNFDLLRLILRRLGLVVVDISRYTVASLGQCSHPVEFETALLQLGRGPIAISGATISPYVRGKSIAGISVPGRRCRWRVLFCAAD